MIRSTTKLLRAVSLLALGGSASAQSSVTLYGVIDVAVEHLTNVGAAGTHLDRMPGLAGGAFPSRLGFRGSDDLGGGWRAIFTLEQGFAPDSGAVNQGGRMFGRQSYVGVSGPWGALTAGRQYTMLYWSLLETDLLGPANFGLASLDSYITNARSDNAVAWRGSFGGLGVGAGYSLGRDAINAGPSPAGTNCPGEASADAQACRAWSAMLKYDRPGWGAALAYDTQRGGPGAFAGLDRSSRKDRRALANGYLKFATLKITAGAIRRDNDGSVQTPRSLLWYGALSYGVSLWTFDAEAFRLKFRSSANAANMLAARATYNLSKRTAVYAMAGHIVNDGALALSISSGQAGGNPLPGTHQNGFTTGIRHAF